jgi:hypothetical protein
MTTDKKREDLVRVYRSGEPLEKVGPIIIELGKQGQKKEAITLLAELVEMHIDLLGSHHRNTMMARYILWSFCYAAGAKAKAVQGYRELLADCERDLGPDHPVTNVVRDALRTSPL